MSTGKSFDEAALMKNALREIRQLRSKLEAFEREKTEPIAVVGMACRFPGAEDANAFWELLARGEDAITEVPKDRWNIDDYFDPDPDAPGKMYTKWGGFIKDIDKFSPAFFGISPREAASMDPQQRLLLEVSWQALENAGTPPDRLMNRQVGVFVGIGATDYSELEVMQGTGAIDPYNGTGGSFSVAAGRLSYFLGVRGPSVAMDTACSSSLTAVHLAVNSLRNGESEVAIAGGVNLMMSPDSLVSLCKARMLSPDGRCKTFDASANGYVRGEGCGALVLKRLSDAVADGDNILALIRGSAVNHNGKSGGLTVPSGPAQQELVERALKNAAITPAEVTYVEAHGTGTSVGDPIEVGALAAVYANRHERPLLIGSVKSNIGHLEWAAGICGLIKVILAMKHGEIPASLHVKKLNPHLDWNSIPVQVVTEKRRWPAGRRIAGVSSFGFGGTNAHVLVEEPPEARTPAREFERPSHIFTLSAKSPEALAELTARYEDSLNSQNIGNICFTVNAGRNHFEHRLAIVTSSTPELRNQLSTAESVRVPAGRPRIAMLFTGQGAQYAGMGRELFETQPAFRNTLERCADILRSMLDRRLLDEVLFPTSAAATEQLVNQTAYTQPALFAIEYALAQLWRSWAIQPEFVIGHSVGEYVAACLAGVFSLEDGLRLIATRGRLMQALPANGAMAAIRAAEEQVTPHLAHYEDKVSIAAVNGPRDVVISGERHAVEAIQSALKTQGIESRQLNVSHAFHSPLMDPMLAEFEAAVRAVRLAPPTIELISNLTGRQVTDEVTDAHYWVGHLREPVRFRAGMETLSTSDVFVEAGPQPVLISLGRQCLPDANALWLPSLSQRRGNWQQMLEALASLYQRGVEIDWQGFDRGYARRKTDLPGYPLERQRYPLPKPSSNGRVARGSAVRPLIESVVQSPAVKETILTTRLSTAAYPYLADHRIYGEVVAPAASYLAMLMNGADALGHQGCRLQDVFFIAPLVLAENAQVNLQVVIEPDSEFQMISFVPGAAPEGAVKHVTGRLNSADSPDVSLDVSLTQARERCTKPMDPDWVSAAAEGIEFGPSFRWIDAIWSGEKETLARLRLPDSITDAADYWLHPGLLDACFQSAEATLGDDVDLPLPFSIGSLVGVRYAAGNEWWTYARQIGEFTWDILLFDSSGASIVAIDGFEARQASRSAFRRSADWLYRIDWQPQMLEVRPPVANGRWLIVDDGTNFGDTVAELLTPQSQGAVVVRSGEVLALVAKGQRDSYVGVVFIAGGDGASPALSAETTSIAALQVVQALAQAQLAPQCWFVTRGSATVAGSEISQDGLAQTSLWGFARTLALEHPELRARLIDLPPRPERDDLKRLVDDLIAGDVESQIAYRSAVRYVARLVRHRESKKPKPVAPFRLQLAEYGSSDQLRVVPLTRRIPGPGEVEIEVKASALNFRDVLIALGMLKEHYAQALKIERAQDVRIGFDCAGTIAAVGEGVTAFKAGDEVMTSAAGSSASFLTTAYTDVALKPQSLTFEEAAVIPTAFFTVHYGLLQLAHLKTGERILIHSAAGGVGQAAVQLAKAVGAEIFATASPGKWAFLKNQGIKHVMNSRTADFAGEVLRLTGGEGVAVVLNSLTGDILDKSFDVLKKGGRFVEIGKLGILTPEEAAQRRPDAVYITFDVDVDTTKNPQLAFETLNQVRELFDSGKLQPLPQTVFPIEDAVEAYRFLQQTKHVGKVVLSFAQQDSGVTQADGSYLITGGLGGLGLGVAQHLVEQGARHIVLAGRSAPSAEALNTVAQLRATGANVSVAQGDIANEVDVSRILAACPQPLRGIVHSAGVLDDGIVENQTPERFARVMAAKAQGAWHLHTQTHTQPLDFFVCFSSMASALGAAGQINYASANSFLDGLAAHRRSLGLCGLSINWGPWAKVGMAAGLSVAGQGVDKIEVEDGLRLFGELLAAQRTSPAQVGVWNVNWPAFQKRLPNAEMPAYLSTMLRQSTPKSTREAARGNEFPRRFRETPEADRLALIESVIRPELLEVLGLGANHDIPATQLWADLGVDSLMMVELKNRLERVVNLTLPIERLARDLTTQKLATFVADKLNETADTPTVVETKPESTAIATSASEDFEKIYQLVAQIPQAYAIADKQQGRQVKIAGRWRIDFASCNYLGLDLHPEVMAAIPPAVAEWGVHPSWTRAVASPRIYAELEQALAEFVGAPTTLVFPSISLLHAGVIPILAGYDGVILKDTEAHHSLHEGCVRAQVNGAEWINFPHSDIDDLAKKLSKYRLNRTKIIATDGVYSMGSSHPPLLEYVQLAKTYNATLYVDDAHGFGVIGERPDNTLPYGYRGNGIVRHFALDYCRDRIVYVAGMSKSFSSYAAFVTCFDEKMKANLESSGPYVFSGPTCTASLASGLAGLRVNAREGNAQRKSIFDMTCRFVTAVKQMGFEVDNGGYFPIVGVVIGGFDEFIQACQLLWEHDILITPAMYPAVPIHRNLVRFSITAANTEAEIDRAIIALEAVWNTLRGAAENVPLAVRG